MYGLKNIMEDAVFSKIKELQPHINCCTCEKCIIDVASYALNRLTPKYVVTSQGEVLGKLSIIEPQKDLDVTSQVLKAFQIIGEQPNH